MGGLIWEPGDQVQQFTADVFVFLSLSGPLPCLLDSLLPCVVSAMMSSVSFVFLLTMFLLLPGIYTLASIPTSLTSWILIASL